MSVDLIVLLEKNTYWAVCLYTPHPLPLSHPQSLCNAAGQLVEEVTLSHLYLSVSGGLWSILPARAYIFSGLLLTLQLSSSDMYFHNFFELSFDHRFTYFSRVSLDYIVKAGKQPDVLHIHNWETSIVGPLFWDVFVNQVHYLAFAFNCDKLLTTCSPLFG